MHSTDDMPDYATYTSAESEDVIRRIDRIAYAERYAAVLAEIEKRSNEPVLEPVEEPIPPLSTDLIVSDFKKAALGAIAGLIGSVILIWMLTLSERNEKGYVNWDHAIGIMIIPILAVPIGALLGPLFGSRRSTKGN